jgi:hypothetical protein
LTNITIGAYLVRPMPSSLRNRLSELAASFSAGVLDAVRGASLEELLSESSGGKTRLPLRAVAVASPSGATASPSPRRRPGRLPRRSSDAIAEAVEKIVGLLGANPGGLRAEQIRQKLGLQAKELPRPLKEGLEGGRLKKVGRKRATTYFVGAGPSQAGKTVSRAARAGRPRKAGAAPKKASAGAAKKAPKARAKRAAGPAKRRSAKRGRATKR